MRFARWIVHVLFLSMETVALAAERSKARAAELRCRELVEANRVQGLLIDNLTGALKRDRERIREETAIAVARWSSAMKDPRLAAILGTAPDVNS